MSPKRELSKYLFWKNYISSLHISDHQESTDLQDSVLLGFIHLPGQTAVSNGIDDDWLVGLGTWLLEEFRT